MARTRLYPPSVDPGFPELPETPPGWRQTTFGEVLEVVARPVKLDPDKTYRLVNAKRSRGGITLRSELPGREILTKTQFEAKSGDFLISRRQIIHGACGVVPDDLDGAVVSNEYSTLKPRPALSLAFLRHYSHTPYFQRTCFHSSHGVDVEKMIFKIGEWLVRRMDLPPLPEQRKIAAILTSVDDAIEATQAVIDHLQVVKRAMMAELLTRGIPGRHTRFKKTEIGEVPEGWELVRVGDVCRLVSGGTPDRARQEYWGGGIPWVKTGEVDYRDIMVTGETISEIGLRSSSAKVVPAGTLLMAMYGQGKTRGRVATLGVDAAINQACLAFLSGEQMDNRFLYHWMSAAYPRLRELGHEGTQKNLNAGLIRDILVPLPPRAEQMEIAAFLSSLDESSRTDGFQKQALLDLKTALAAVLLTGEVRVKPDEDAA